MRLWLRRGAIAAAIGGVLAVGAATGSAHSNHGNGDRHGNEGGTSGKIAHVLLISVDGLHQSDLQWYSGLHPNSTLATLSRGGAEYSNARTPIPSDSFPGMVGQVTGGNPATTGVYYDAEYNHNLLAPGTACPSGQRGTAVDYFEIIAKDPSRLDSGQGIHPLPDNILTL